MPNSTINFHQFPFRTGNGGTTEEGSHKKFKYEGFVLGIPGELLSSDGWRSRFERTGGTIGADISRHAGRSFFDIISYDDSWNELSRYEEYQVPVGSIDDLIAYAQTLCPQSGGAYTVYSVLQVYDIVDDAVPRIERIYGYNEILYQVLGRRKALDSEKSVALPYSAGQRWNYLYSFISEAYEEVFGTPIGTPPSDGNNGYRILWCGSNGRKRYGAPPSGTWVNGTRPLERYYYDSVADTYLPAGGMVLGVPKLCTFYDPSLFSFKNPYQFSTVREGLIYPQCLVYPLTGPAPTDRALYLKAVGIDAIHIDAFDQSKYALEVVGLRKNHTPRFLHQLDPLPEDLSQFRGAYRIKKISWTQSQSEIMNMGLYEPWTLRFRLRDKATNHVGPFSVAKIAPVMNTLFRRFFYMVK